MRKLGRVSKSAIYLVKHLQSRFQNRVNHGGRDSATPRKRFRPRDCTLDQLSLLHHFSMLLAVSRWYREQHALEARSSLPVRRRKIGAPIKRLAVRSKKRGKRPSALPSE